MRRIEGAERFTWGDFSFSKPLSYREKLRLLVFDPDQPRDEHGRFAGVTPAPVLPKGHAIRSEATASYSGQTNMKTVIRDADGKQVAYADYVIFDERHDALDRKNNPHVPRDRADSVYRPEVTISMIEVDKGARRKGLAMAILRQIAHENPGVPINSGMRTEEGGKLWKAWENRPERIPLSSREPRAIHLEFNPDQPRDESGKWTSSDAGAAAWHADTRDRIAAIVPSAYVDDTKATTTKAANTVANVLEDMKALGYKMPDAVAVALAGHLHGEIKGTQIKPEDVGVRYGPLKTHLLRLSVNIPSTLPNDANLEDAVMAVFSKPSDVSPKYAFNDPDYKVYDKFVARSMRDVVVHEMGHVQAGHRGDWKLGQLLNAGTFGSTDQIRRAAYRVSEYAWQNEDEFIAEAFTRQMRGETLAEDSLKLYQALNGPEILKKAS